MSDSVEHLLSIRRKQDSESNVNTVSVEDVFLAGMI